MIAFGTSSVVWGNSVVGLDGADLPLRSSWAFQGKPIVFVSYDVANIPAPRDGTMHHLAYHERSLATFAGANPRRRYRSKECARPHCHVIREVALPPVVVVLVLRAALRATTLAHLATCAASR